MRNIKIYFAFGVLSVAPLASGQYMQFTRGTDTINFGAFDTFGTTAYTIEAVVKPTNNSIVRLFTEQKDGGEDKQMGIGTDGVISGAWTPKLNYGITWHGSVPGDGFHHVAWVRSGATHSLYLDGTRVATQTLTGTDNVPISNASGSRMSVGAFQYTTAGNTGAFLGWVDSIRVSNIDRYTGASASVVLGDQALDSNTQFLMNFDAANPFRESVTGIGGAGGSGFSGATSPTAVPEPTTVAGVLIGTVLLARRRVRR